MNGGAQELNLNFPDWQSSSITIEMEGKQLQQQQLRTWKMTRRALLDVLRVHVYMHVNYQRRGVPMCFYLLKKNRCVSHFYNSPS